MPLQLRDNVHWCASSGRAVFLDLEADRYFCLPATANAAFMRLAIGGMQSGDADLLEMLVERGILVEAHDSTALRRPPFLEPPGRDWLDDRPPGVRPVPMLRALASEISAARLLRRKSFVEVIEAAGRRRGSKTRRTGCDQHRSLGAIVQASAAVSYLAGAQDRCLVRALAVHSMCSRIGVRPKLVLGVIAHPFAAHCWVQLGNAVLVGSLEQARLYTPILVLE